MLTLPTTALTIIETLKNSAFTVYAVGGSVRDTIMGIPTRGWDFATSATPEQTLSLFPDSFYDNRFGTVGVKIYTEPRTPQSEPADIYEITTYRSEKEYRDFRHPDKVTWGRTIEEDLSRRDFTINAIASDGREIVDPYGGQKHLQEKLIQAVGDPQARFREDALRMMRAVRIATQLGFLISAATRDAIAGNADLLKNISAERIRDELMKLMAFEHAADGILLMRNTGILKVILPELDAAFAVGQKSPQRHHIYDVGTHSVMALKYCPSGDPVVRLATLLHDIGKVETAKTDPQGIVTFYNHEVNGARAAVKIAGRLKLTKKHTEKLVTLVRWHQFSVDERQTDSAIRRIIRRIGTENLEDMLALRTGDRLGGGAKETSWRLELFRNRLEEVQKQPFSVSDLKVNGHDVMKILEVAPGPVVGKVLGELFAEVENGKLSNERDALIRKIEEMRKIKSA
ncbi:hypothetical protein A2Z33_07180 [Candidatus Gottesmanbacteria bacterium RBG_16_52_11]|uniref:HD domain-containing protein n=1 Tax=Candidatus Gottesmanbacteria bacterium RBG_16_52_11 TaxID=1798374 RepID=A0A1F5YY25_9BACT|nr:MAG: hypothetical protein A2Z33_07180 [Candidatus Gottesmanbacteria bacterium RBG_16_52_11]